MNIQAQSSMAFGDFEALQDFVFVHRLAHQAIDKAAALAGFGAMPSPTLDDQRVMRVWQALMSPLAPNIREEDERVLRDWLELHGNLHRAEYAAYKLGEVPELIVVDFRDRNQFYDWMAVHAGVHLALNIAAGVS